MTKTTRPFPDSGKRANRLFLYVPLALGALVFVAYTIVWFIGAGMMRTEVAHWIEDQRARGMTVEHGKIAIQGFPFLLRAKISAPIYGDIAAGWEWQADTLYADTLPYNPTRLILAPHGDQKVNIANGNVNETWQVSAASIKASISQAATALEIHETVAVPENGTSSTGFDKLEIGALRANTLISDDVETGYPDDIGTFAMEGQKIALSGPDGRGDIIVNFVDAGLRATSFQAFLAAASDEVGFETWRQQGGEVSIDGFRLVIANGTDSPPSQLAVAGVLRVDDQNYPAGQIETSLANHGALLSILQQNGVMSAEHSDTAEDVLNTVTAMMGDELKVPIHLRDGKAQIKLPISSVTIARLNQLD